MKALALVDAPDHVCCRYRIRAFEPALGVGGWKLTVQGFERHVFRRWSQIRASRQYDAVVVQRKLLPGWQFAELRRAARHLVFDFDDAVLYRDSNDPRGPHCRRRARRFSRTVSQCDAVIAGNDFLADCALRAGARADRVQVIPTCVDATRYRTAEKSLNHAHGQLDLVWIGSSSTLKGLERQRPLWERIGRELPGVRLRVICDAFPRFGAMPVIDIPWSEATESQALAEGDVGVSWIPDDLWSRGKCGLKVLQYQAAGLPVIANPVGVQTEMITPGVSGYLGTTEDEWIASVRSLAQNPELRREMGATGRASVETGYAVAAWAETFVIALSRSTSAENSSPRATRGSGASTGPLAGRSGVARDSPLARPHFGGAKRTRIESPVDRPHGF